MTEDRQALWLNRFKATQAQEKQLKELLHQKGATGVAHARDRLREEYERLILTDVVQAQAKEIESALWKNVFYIVIDGYRRKLSTLGRPENNVEQQGGKRDTRRDREGGGRSRPHGNRGNKAPLHSIEYRKVSTKFRAFIQEATGFYHRLIQNLASYYDLNEGGASMQSGLIADADKRPLAEVTDLARQSAINSCHKCYIFLGDLARYRQTYSESAKNNWSSARDYYNEARSLLPSSGNPYNQLAVIATLAPNSFLALYFYYRSLAVRVPFMTARNNIKVLIQKMETDPESSKKFVREERYNERQATSAKDSSQLNDFLAKFILLHGALFMNTVDGFDADLMGSTFEHLILDRQIDQDVLLKILIINMSSLYTKSYIPLQEDGAAPSPHNQLESERQALQLILTAFATILRYSTQDLETHSKGDHKSNGRPVDFLPSSVHRSMAALRLSIKWMQVNFHHVRRLSDGLLDKEKDRFHLKQIWNDLATFLTLLGQVHPYTEGTIFCRDVLKEDAELQGFAALKRAIDERPLSIIPPSRVSPKSEMQMRIADMFEDALMLTRADGIEFFAKTTEMAEGKQGLCFFTRREHADSRVGSTRTTVKGSALTSSESEDESDYEREAKDEDLNPFHIKRGARSSLQRPLASSGSGTEEEAAVDHDVHQRQAVAALLSDDDNDLSLIVGNDEEDDEDDDEEDDDEEEEEEVVLFKGRSSAVSGKPTPRPAHLKTTTGVIGAGRRGSMSPIGSNNSSPGLDVNGPSRFGPLRPTVDGLFGGFEFGAVDDWRHSISSLRTSPTGNMWGGLSSNSLGNGTISPTTYEPRDGNVLTGFTSIPSRAPPGITHPASPLSDNPSGFMSEEQFFQYQQQNQPRHVLHSRPKYQYQSYGLHPQEQGHSQYGENSGQSLRDRDWR